MPALTDAGHVPRNRNAAWSCVQQAEAATPIKEPDQPVHGSMVKSRGWQAPRLRLLGSRGWRSR